MAGGAVGLCCRACAGLALPLVAAGGGQQRGQHAVELCSEARGVCSALRGGSCCCCCCPGTARVGMLGPLARLPILLLFITLLL